MTSSISIATDVASSPATPTSSSSPISISTPTPTAVAPTTPEVVVPAIAIPNAPPPTSPAADPALDARSGMFDLVLRGQKRLSALLRDEAALPQTIQKLLLLSLLGLAVHGLVFGLVMQTMKQTVQSEGSSHLFSRFREAQQIDCYNAASDVSSCLAARASRPVGGDFAFASQGHPLVWMPFALMLAFVGSLGICLPSFYFYTQLAGVDASFRLVVAHALRANATTSLMLLGALPFYAAYALGALTGVIGADAESVAGLGLVMPFLVGLSGLRALYVGFCDLAEVLPQTHKRRGNFLRRMVLCWGALYTVVAPVALYRIAEAFGRLI